MNSLPSVNSAAQPSRRTLPVFKPALLFLSISAGLWLAVFLGGQYWIHVGSTDPNQWMPLIFAEPFRDFTIFRINFSHFHSLKFFDRHEGWPFTYPAAAALIYEFFFGLFPRPLPAFLAFAVGTPVCVALLFGWALVKRGLRWFWAFPLVLLTLLSSYPFWFEWQRGNIEVALWAILVAAFFAYGRGRYTLSALLFGAAIAIKIYPFIFFGLLISRKKYWQAALGVVTGLLVNEICLHVVGPTYGAARAGIRAGLEFFTRTYLIESASYGFDHSLLGLIKAFLFLPGPTAVQRNYHLLTGYMIVMAVAGVCLYLFRIYWMPETNRIAALAVISILIPPVSYDYTLIHLYFAWAFLVLYLMRGGLATKPVFQMFGLLAIIMSPEGYLYYMNVRISGQLKCVALAALLYLLLRHPLDADGAPADPAFAKPPSFRIGGWLLRPVTSSPSGNRD